MLSAVELALYFRRFAPEEVIGIAGEPDTCPLAAAITALLTKERMSVFPEDIAFDDDEDEGYRGIKTTPWQREFVLTVDGRIDGAVRHSVVTAHQALLALEEALRIVAWDEAAERVCARQVLRPKGRSLWLAPPAATGVAESEPPPKAP